METNSESRHTQMVTVWYKLGDKSPSRVTLEDNAIIDDLKDAIKTKWGDRLPCAPPELKVFAAGTVVPITDDAKPLKEDRKVSDFLDSNGTTADNSFIVVAPEPPPQQQQDGESACCSRTALNTVLL